jgi:hypothetical protein
MNRTYRYSFELSLSLIFFCIEVRKIFLVKSKFCVRYGGSLKVSVVRPRIRVRIGMKKAFILVRTINE